MNNNPIGVFDSGIGGLTVVAEILKQLPDESLIYLGDTARVPYGTRGNEVITQFALQLVNFLIGKKVKFLVVACNTISSISLDYIKKISPVPVLGVIESAAKQAVLYTKTGYIGVIGTQATISSQGYDKTMIKLNPKISIISQACPLFVPLAEEGLVDDKITGLVARKYLQNLKKSKIDTLILGCTHYPILKKAIQKVVGKKIYLIDSASPTVSQLKLILEKNKLKSDIKKANYQFFVTDAPQRVYNVAGKFLGIPLDGKLKKTSL